MWRLYSLGEDNSSITCYN